MCGRERLRSRSRHVNAVRVAGAREAQELSARAHQQSEVGGAERHVQDRVQHNESHRACCCRVVPGQSSGALRQSKVFHQLDARSRKQ